MNFPRLFAAAALSCGLVVGSTGTANAHYLNGELWATNDKICQGADRYDMVFTYESNGVGAWRYLGYSEWDFNNLGTAGSDSGGPYAARFCSGAQGAGQNIKNNSEWAANRSPSYNATVYQFSGYGGASDYFGRGSYGNLVENPNDNASFAWG